MDTRAPARAGRTKRHDGKQLLPALSLIALIVLALSYILPAASRRPLTETTVWSLVLITSFAGWGSLVHFVVTFRRGQGRAAWLSPDREQADLGLRVGWGAACLCFVGGALMVPALMTRAAAFALVEIGVALAIGAILREHAGVRRRALFAWRIANRERRLILVVAAVAIVVALVFLGGISDLHTNPYDDDIAYLAFVKKLLHTGTLLEPFSFRRLSAFGGQTFFLELVSLRARPNQGHTFDKSICVLMVVLLIVGHRVRGRRLPLYFTLATTMMFLTIPSIAINTASYNSGVAFFLLLYRTMVWAGETERAPWRSAVPLGIVGAAACTLRQNYLPVPAIMLGSLYLSQFIAKRTAFRTRLAEPLWTLAISVVALAPWCIVSWQSNRTFLYPIFLGTFNKALQVQSATLNVTGEAFLQIWFALEGSPIKTLGLFAVATTMLRERDPRKPLWSFAIGTALGVILVVHAFSQADAPNVGRYAFAYLTAFVLAVSLSTGLELSRPTRRVTLASGLLVFAMLAQLVVARQELWKSCARTIHNIELARSRTPNASLPPEQFLYISLQNSVPPGERIAAMVDEPHYLDFARNPIWNLDMPGYSSLAPGIPFFVGSQKIEDYFKSIGVRYIAYIKPEYSRYHYRRNYFVELLVDETELWRGYAPYMVNFIDSMVELDARHRRVFDERGLVVFDLAEPR